MLARPVKRAASAASVSLNDLFSCRGGFNPEHPLLVTNLEKSRCLPTGQSPGQLQLGLARADLTVLSLTAEPIEMFDLHLP